MIFSLEVWASVVEGGGRARGGGRGPWWMLCWTGVKRKPVELEVEMDDAPDVSRQRFGAHH